MEIQQKCIQQGVYYIEGKKEENKYECRSSNTVRYTGTQ